MASINNQAATKYYFGLYNLKPIGNGKVNVPLYYNNTTKQLSAISPLVLAN